MYKSISFLLLLCTISVSAFASPHRYDITFYDELGKIDHTVQLVDSESMGTFSPDNGTMNSAQPFHTIYTSYEDTFDNLQILIAVGPIEGVQFVQNFKVSKLHAGQGNICHILPSKLGFDIQCD